MFIIPVYKCRNCNTFYEGARIEIANAPLEKFVAAARFTLGTPDHILRIAGKTIQLSDLHMCSKSTVAMANFVKLKIET